jgi:REP element-mobilizing transposase RayT
VRKREEIQEMLRGQRMTLFRNRYRIESARLTEWDYSSPGRYFVTICLLDRSEMFGMIMNDEMRMNDYGNIVDDEWGKSFEIRHELKRDEFVVMPNHIHGIVRMIGSSISVETHGPVETHGRASLQTERKQTELNWVL